MAQVSPSKLDLDEEDVELSLGLSLGGSSRKRPSIPSSSSSIDLRALDGRDDAECVPVSAVNLSSMDPQKRRELHALRRQEARKKREQKKNGNGIHVFKGVTLNRADSMPEKTLLEMQRSEARVRDRAAKENEGGRSENNVALTLLSNPNPNPNPSFGGYHPNGFKVMQPAPGAAPHTAALQYAFPPPMGYVPFRNGFHYPYTMNYWGPAAGTVPQQQQHASDSASKAADRPRPDGCRAFRPFQASADRDQSSSRAAAGSESGQNGSGGCGGPSTSSSSDQSDSMRGGCSSDTRSHSSRPQFVKRQVSPLLNPQQHQLDRKSSTQPLELAPQAEETVDKSAAVTGTKASSSKPDAPAAVNNSSIPDAAIAAPSKPEHPIATVDPGSITKSPLPCTAADGQERDEGKKPEPPMPSLPHMPCVSTTGNGPNGKTITGFLYRYTKSEVSIVCVCHGSSFTPAEFVKHAGGTDVTHPLKHIVVVPSAFG